MTLFHSRGFAFRDGHQRNFMLSGQGEELDVFVVDYGSSTTFDGKVTDDVYVEGEKTFPNDKDILAYLDLLKKKATGRDLTMERVQGLQKQVKSLRKALLRSGATWKKITEEAEQVGLDIKKIIELVRGSGLFHDNEGRNTALVVILIDFVISKKYSSVEVKEVLQRYINKQKEENLRGVEEPAVTHLKQYLLIL